MQKYFPIENHIRWILVTWIKVGTPIPFHWHFGKWKSCKILHSSQLILNYECYFHSLFFFFFFWIFRYYNCNKWMGIIFYCPRYLWALLNLETHIKEWLQLHTNVEKLYLELGSFSFWSWQLLLLELRK